MLASQSGDVLTLNMGPRAGDRVFVNIKDGDETFKVTHVSGVAGNETVKVSAFGLEQTFTGVRHIVGQGRPGDDTITLEEGVLATVRAVGRLQRPGARRASSATTRCSAARARRFCTAAAGRTSSSDAPARTSSSATTATTACRARTGRIGSRAAPGSTCSRAATATTCCWAVTMTTS